MNAKRPVPTKHPSWGRASEEFQVYLGDSLNTSNKLTLGQINLIGPQICLSSPCGLGLVMPYSSFLMKIDFLNKLNILLFLHMEKKWLFTLFFFPEKT
jgi:hypothetical protein